MESGVYQPDLAWERTIPAINYGSSAILHGAVVCRDASTTDSVASVQRVKRVNGIAVPASANVHRILGILQANDGKKLIGSQQHGGKVVAAGMAQALVKVPASTNLAEDTLLVLATTWDATNNDVDYGHTLEPVVYNSTILTPANPIAILRQAYDNSGVGSATTKLLWVEVLPWHKPLPFVLNYHRSAVVAAVDEILMQMNLGPGVIEGMLAQLNAAVTTSGDVSISCQHAPLGTTADVQDAYTTDLKFDSAGSPSSGAVAGPAGGNSVNGLCGEDGDTDTARTLGTAGSNGVRAALSVRQFSCPSIITLTLAGTPGGGATDLSVQVYGFYY